MKNKKLLLFTVIVLAIGFIAGINFYQNSVDTKNEELAASGSAAFVRDHSPSFGANKNNVTIVEFVDPECESCAYFNPIVKKIFYEYKDEVKFVYRYLDNHKNSRYAIQILEAARKQGKYKETLNIMFKYQPIWAAHNAPKPELIWNYLPEAGLDIEKLKVDFENTNVDKIVTIDRIDATKLGVTGTPTVFVNGKMLRKLDYKSFLDLVESEVYK